MYEYTRKYVHNICCTCKYIWIIIYKLIYLTRIDYNFCDQNFSKTEFFNIVIGLDKNCFGYVLFGAINWNACLIFSYNETKEMHWFLKIILE
jgi:hypothetical protein